MARYVMTGVMYGDVPGVYFTIVRRKLASSMKWPKCTMFTFTIDVYYTFKEIRFEKV